MTSQDTSIQNEKTIGPIEEDWTISQSPRPLSSQKWIQLNWQPLTKSKEISSKELAQRACDIVHIWRNKLTYPCMHHK